MPRYTKLPVTIEAVRFIEIRGGAARFCFDDDPPPCWLDQALNTPAKQDGAIFLFPSGDKLHVGTSEGLMTASPGDWIIRGVAGEVYPCKPDIFARTYIPEEEPVERNFEQELSSLINIHSLEGGSDTPDFILAGFLRECLEAFNSTLQLRERWYDRPIAAEELGVLERI